jgi:beta-N-acetylhexosaminidase
MTGKKLSLKEKIAQMLICGINGAKVDEESKELVQRTKVGGIILYAKNTPTAADTFKLTYGLKERAAETGIPLIISIDEEHGRVGRIKEGTTRFVDMAAVGRSNDPAIAGEIAAVTSRELMACGINLNFAPVCDVNINPENKVIGDRSFSSDPETAANMVSAYVKKGVRTGMMLCAKHFPGHGDTAVDSHLDLPVVDKPLQEIEKCELVPFKAAIRAKVQTIMTAHIVFPLIDDLPATMSKKIISGILIKKLGFKGIIISDDMNMGAIAENYGVKEAFALSINAGVNMFIVSNMLKHKINVNKLIDDIEKAVSSGAIDERMIDSSVDRILKLKDSHLKDINPEKTLRESSLRQSGSLKLAEYLQKQIGG